MKFNKNIILGTLLIILSIFILFSDALNGIIRPITYIFLMGSSKGKDILFFGLFGLFIILSQLYKLDFVNNHLKENINDYLKITIILSVILAISGIAFEVILRNSLNLGLNTIFVALNPDMTSTSILHSHIFKSIFGELVNSFIGSSISSNIHLGHSLFSYIPQIAILFTILFPIIAIFSTLSLQKRSFPITLLLSFFASCSLIGILDGGFFSVPGIVGIGGMILIYMNHEYLDILFKGNFSNYLKSYKLNLRYLYNRYLPFLIVILIIGLRFSITLLGANTEYYEVNIENLNEDIDFASEFNVLKITESSNKTTLLISPEYNEMELLKEISDRIEGKSDFMSLSWNGFSYL